MVSIRHAGLLALALLAACAPVVDTAPMAVSPAAVPGALFVAGKFGNTLAKVDLASGQEVVRVASCANPHELATSPDERHVALACYGGQTVDIFRTSDLGKVASIDLGANARPHGIVWHDNGQIYATAEGRQSVFVISDPMGDARTHEHATGKQGSHMIAVSPDGRTAWTTDLQDKTVTRIDLASDRAPMSAMVGEEPEGIALTPDGKTLWVSARGSDRAFALDPQTLNIRNKVATGDFPLRVIVRPQGDVAVTSDLADGALTVIDTATARKLRKIAVSSAVEAQERFQVTILFSPDGERMYVAETRSDTIAEVDFASGTVLRRLPGTGGGDGIAIIE